MCPQGRRGSVCLRNLCTTITRLHEGKEEARCDIVIVAYCDDTQCRDLLLHKKRTRRDNKRRGGTLGHND